MRNRHVAIAGLSLGLLLVLPQLASAAAKPLFNCQLITLPGSYIVTRSITVVVPTCFTILADDVKIDLDGQTLTGQNGGLGGNQQAITDNGVARRSVEITNGAITGFRRAIELGACTSCKVSWMRIDDNGDGINIGMNALVYKNIVTDSKDDGIHATREALIRDNLSNDNGSEGIEVQKNSIVKNNVTQGNGGAGLNLQCPALIVQNISQQNSPNETDNGPAGCEFIENSGF